jgi:hypothetical protein
VNKAIAIEVQQLKAALELVLTRVEQQVGPAIDLTADYYWKIPPEVAYDPLVKPEIDALTLGQLSDDVEEVRSLLERDDDDGVIVWHDLRHLVGVLRRDWGAGPARRIGLLPWGTRSGAGELLRPTATRRKKGCAFVLRPTDGRCAQSDGRWEWCACRCSRAEDQRLGVERSCGAGVLVCPSSL